MNHIPIIAIVGRPNVGKSTLFNRLTATRNALVANLSGLTRDRHYGYASIAPVITQKKRSRKFVDIAADTDSFDSAEQGRHAVDIILIDTGGIEDDVDSGIPAQMRAQTELAITEADCVLFMVDAHQGLTPDDQFIAQLLRKKYQKPIFLIANKIDIADPHALHEFHALAMTDILGVSASHAQGMDQLNDFLYRYLKKIKIEEKEARVRTEHTVVLPDKKSAIYFAIIGRPNVGKSTLVNRMLGEERVIVFDEPGTTRDSLFIPFERKNQQYVIIDTAGIRRRQRVKESVEKFSVIKALQAIEQAHIVLLVIDAVEGISEQDLRLIGHVYEEGRAMLIVVNKWDGLDDYHKQRVREELKRRLNFLDYAEKFFISALHGSNVGLLYDALSRAHQSLNKKLTTHTLTKILQQLTQRHQPPIVRGHRIKLRYAHPGGHMPPCIVIHGTLAEELPLSYKRYLENEYRLALGLIATPIRIQLKTTDNPYAQKKH